MAYKREELDYMAAQMLPVILEKLGVEAQGVSEVEVVNDLTGVFTLPAYKKVGGVEKIVEAPLELLSKPIDNAVDECKEAAGKANAAASAANTAAGSVNAAKDAAQAATNNANNAAASVEAAKTAASTAAAGANAARDSANTATTKANTAADGANAARDGANTAKVNTEAAIRNAQTATMAAETATSNANKASQAANTAADAANKEASSTTTAKNEAQEAAARANTASSNAEAEIAKMKELQQSISGAASLSPTRMELTYLKEISTCNPYPQKIGFKLLPSFSLQNVLFLPAGGESVSVDPSGTLTINKTGITRFYVIPTGATHLYQAISITIRSPKIRKTSGGKMRLSGGKVRVF